jgi:hypothetical protein
MGRLAATVVAWEFVAAMAAQHCLAVLDKLLYVR